MVMGIELEIEVEILLNVFLYWIVATSITIIFDSEFVKENWKWRWSRLVVSGLQAHWR